MEGGMMMKLRKERCNPYDYAAKILNNKTEDETYKRYKHRCYRNLVLKSLLSFLLGLLVSFLFRCLVGITPR